MGVCERIIHLVIGNALKSASSIRSILQEFQLGKESTYSFNKVVAVILLTGEIRWELQPAHQTKRQNMPHFLSANFLCWSTVLRYRGAQKVSNIFSESHCNRMNASSADPRAAVTFMLNLLLNNNVLFMQNKKMKIGYTKWLDNELKVKCPYCGKEFTFTLKEITYGFLYPESIKCKFCNNFIELKDDIK